MLLLLLMLCMHFAHALAKTHRHDWAVGRDGGVCVCAPLLRVTLLGFDCGRNFLCDANRPCVCAIRSASGHSEQGNLNVAHMFFVYPLRPKLLNLEWTGFVCCDKICMHFQQNVSPCISFSEHAQYCINFNFIMELFVVVSEKIVHFLWLKHIFLWFWKCDSGAWMVKINKYAS